MPTQIKLICPCLPIEKIVSCYLCQQPFGHWPGNPFGLSALALVFLIACHGLDESWLMIIQEDRHAKSLPWACCTFLVMCVKASLCVCYSHVSISFYVHMCVSIDFPMIGEAFLSILPKNQDWEWVLGTIGDALSDWVTEWLSGWVAEWPSDRMSELPSN